jgi:hypothetical protein
MIDWDMAAVIVATVMATLAVVKLIGGSTWKLSGRLTSMESSLTAVQINIIAVQEEIKRLGEVLIKIADMRGELRLIDNRIGRAEQDIRDLQHGESYVLPIAKSAHERP